VSRVWLKKQDREEMVESLIVCLFTFLQLETCLEVAQKESRVLL